MTFARYSLLGALLRHPARWPGSASLHRPTGRPRNRPAPSAQSQPAAAQPNPQAYTLPPDKLAKAIALSRIRNILDIVGSLWGLAFLWLLLATRAAAAPGCLG